MSCDRLTVNDALLPAFAFCNNLRARNHVGCSPAAFAAASGQRCNARDCFQGCVVGRSGRSIPCARSSLQAGAAAAAHGGRQAGERLQHFVAICYRASTVTLGGEMQGSAKWDGDTCTLNVSLPIVRFCPLASAVMTCGSHTAAPSLRRQAERLLSPEHGSQPLDVTLSLPAAPLFCKWWLCELMSRGLAANLTTDFYTIYVFRILWAAG